MDKKEKCSFCNTEQSLQTPLIAGMDGHICEACVRLANQVIVSWGRKRDIKDRFEKPPKPKMIKNRLDEYIIDQDSAKRTLSVAVYNHYKRLHSDANLAGLPEQSNDVELEKSNILLLGPSGSGKTLLARTLAEIVGVPFIIADATSLTQAGYVGDDVESILTRLLDAADGNVGLAEWGMVYIDEIDKIARNPDASFAVRDISGEGVQQALLKLVEGSKISVPVKGKRKDHGETVVMDTRNILFIAGGAFSGLEQVLARRRDSQAGKIGFHAELTSPAEAQDNKTDFSSAKASDLRHFGLIPEFIGRFPVIATLEELDEAALVRILTEPRNALVRQYQKLFRYDDIELIVTPEAIQAMAAEARKNGTGARGLRSLMEKLLADSMFVAPSMPDLRACVVDVDAVIGKGQIEYRSKLAQLTEQRVVL